MTVRMSVGLPLFNSAKIAWLALEGLVRQVTPPVVWEILIAEEINGDHVGHEEIKALRPRLRAAGCLRIAYLPLNDWIPLSRKWAVMGRAASPTSEVFLLHGGDDYSHPTRLQETWDVFAGNDGVDWFHYPKGHFYDIASGTVGLFDSTTDPSYEENKRPRLNMALRTKFMRKLPDETQARGVDAWLAHHVGRQCPDETLRIATASGGDWSRSLFTDGVNTCSGHRADMINQEIAPFSKPATPLADIVPPDVAARLESMRGPTLVRTARRDVDNATGLASACGVAAGLRGLVWGT